MVSYGFPMVFLWFSNQQVTWASASPAGASPSPVAAPRGWAAARRRTRQGDRDPWLSGPQRQWVDKKGKILTGNHRFSHEDHGMFL